MTLQFVVNANILQSDATVLCNTVNCVGAMGKGLALQVAQRYPACVRPYVIKCHAHELRPGQILPWTKGERVIWHIATKDHWRAPSQLVWIEQALDRIVGQAAYLSGKSIALPPLGCGNGGLSWSVVGPLMVARLSVLGDDVDVRIHVPSGWPTEF